jgi:hypothetical protein
VEEKRCNTSVTIPKPALDRLNEIGRALGNKSRDKTGRDLILKYITRNKDLPADDRLTHISTVMRHPLPPPRWSDEGPVVPIRRLKLRLPNGASEKAQSLAFRLPGQAKSGGHTHYRSRPLTDAVMTSIAYECRELGLDPITDQVLTDVYPLIRQRAARGLWRLAANATRTGAERAILREAQGSEEDRESTKRIPGNGSSLGMWKVSPRYSRWTTSTTAKPCGITIIGISFEGRGGGAVWRAERIMALSNIADWLSQSANSSGTRSLRVDPPGWRLELPGAWNPSFFTGSLPDVWAEHVANRRVLHFDLDRPLPPGALGTRSRSHMVWPTIDDNGEPTPVAGLQTVLSALMDNATDRRKAADPRTAAEILLLELMPRGTDAGLAWHKRKRNTPDAADPPFSNPITANDNFPYPTPTDQWADLSATSSLAMKDQPKKQMEPRYPGDVPPLPDFSRKTQPAETAEDTADPRIEEDRWYDDWVRSSGGASDVFLPVYVPAETAQQLGFIDEAHAQRLIDDAKARNETAIDTALKRALLDHGQDDRDALEKVKNDPAQFAQLAHKLRIEFREVTAAWCWYVPTLSEETETDPERLRWLSNHLTEVYTRALEHEMHDAVRRAAARFAYLHRR